MSQVADYVNPADSRLGFLFEAHLRVGLHLGCHGVVLRRPFGLHLGCHGDLHHLGILRRLRVGLHLGCLGVVRHHVFGLHHDCHGVVRHHVFGLHLGCHGVVDCYHHYPPWVLHSDCNSLAMQSCGFDIWNRSNPHPSCGICRGCLGDLYDHHVSLLEVRFLPVAQSTAALRYLEME